METVTVVPINVSVTNQGDGNISRNQLLDWLNDTLLEGVAKIEDMSSGVLYCQMLNELFHDSIPMNKIKRNPQHPYERQYNLKQLQYAFHDLGIIKQIDVEKVARGKFQDNFEFLQWFRKFYIVNYENIKEASKAKGLMKKCRSHRSLQNCQNYSTVSLPKRSRTSPALKKMKITKQFHDYEYEYDQNAQKKKEVEIVSALANDLEQYEDDYGGTENEYERKVLERRIYHQILSRIETLLEVQMERYGILQKAFAVLSNMSPNSSYYDLHNFVPREPYKGNAEE